MAELRPTDSVDSFTAAAVAVFFRRTCCVKHKRQDKRELGLFKEEFRCTEMLCLCSETHCCFDLSSNKLNYSSKGLNKHVLEQSGDGPLEKYRKVVNEKVNVTANKKRFCLLRSLQTNNHSLATYEQDNKRLFYFYPKRRVGTYRLHTQPLNL